MAEVRNREQVRTPAGGMNQDDSLLTPSKDNAGRSAFETGDYRYALNARIGSSHSDSFGDLENIRGTVEVTDYNVYGSLVQNPDFTASLSPWLQISAGAGWISNANTARVATSLGVYTGSDILYQAVSPTSKRISVSYKYNIVSGFTSGVQMYLVYLNGTTTISEERINSFGINTTETRSSLYFDIPDSCDGVGIKFNFVVTGDSILDLDYLKINGFMTGTKPAGTERVIGRYEDKEFLRLYYAVYNSSGNHSLRCYDKAVGKIFEILKWSGLSFGSKYFAKIAKLDNWMAITDRNNNPRLIDVDTISQLFFELGSDFREFHISFHKWAPVMPPVLRKYYDGSIDNFEKLKYKVYQFSYRYIYKGYLRSCWSPSSVGANSWRTLNITAIEVYAPGVILDDPGAAVQYNYFNHDNIKFTSAVIGIEYGYRESQLDLWRVFKTVDIQSSGNTFVRFSGPSNSTPIATTDFTQLFDTVPFLAGTVEAIDNRFIFGDCLDEQEAAPKPMLTDIGVVQTLGITTADLWNTTFAAAFSSLSTADKNEMVARNGVSDWSFKSRGLYKLAIQYMHKSGWISAGYTTDEWSYEIPTSQNIAETENALTFKFADSFKPPSWAVAYQLLRTDCLNIDYFMFGVANDFIPLIDNPSQIIDTASLPQNIKDRLRQHFENSRTVNGYELTAEIQKEQDNLSFDNKFDELRFRVQSKANDQAVKRAKLMRYLGTNSLYHKIGPEVRNTQSTLVVSSCSRILININNWYNSSTSNSGGTANNPMNNLYYNFREGDRVRFVASTVATPNNTQKQIFDVPILEFTGTSLIIEKPEGVLWLPKNDAYRDIALDYTIEVYTPRIPQEEDYLYYETGEWFPILYPGTDQRDWSKKDWTYTNNAAVTANTYGDVKVFNKFPFNKGDCSFFNKTVYKNWDSANFISVNLRTNSMNQNKNETYGEWERGDGRPSFAYRQLPVVRFKPTQARFGLQIVEESFINNLNRFLDENQFIYPSEYGRIRDLINTSNAQVESTGSILLAIGEREAWSIYVNRTTLEDLSGRTQVVLSNKVLGSYNTLLGSHGTLNPESISMEHGRIYWWDVLNGVWIRYGRDGLTEISFYKMRNWFREIASLIIDAYLTNDVPLAISEYDPYNEELVTYIDHIGLPETFRGYSNYKGSLFSEEDTRWKSCHNYAPERMGKVGTQLISFKDGSLYLHEQNDNHSTFYGTKYQVQWEPVFNDDLVMKKVWHALAYIATEKWSAERILSEYRGTKAKQQASIQMDVFVEKEDNFYAAIPRDVNTPNTVSPGIEGNMMRSKAIQALLQLDPTVLTRSLMSYAMAECADSPKNP